MRTVLTLTAIAFVGLSAASCGQKAEDTAANPQGSGEGMAYSADKDRTVQADATPGSLRTGSLDAQPAPLNPTATTGSAAGGVTQRPATPPNTAADGRVDQ